MTIGHVGADGDALVPLPVRGPGGAEQEVEAVLDTGFNGYLALPPPVIEALRLERLGQETARAGQWRAALSAQVRSRCRLFGRVAAR